MMMARKRESYKQKIIILLGAAIFVILVIFIVVAMNMKNTFELRSILIDSIKSQLLSTSVAARGVLDVDAFISYNSVDDVMADRERYDSVLSQLITLNDSVGSKYIYALKRLGDKFYFVFVTDETAEDSFISYQLSSVHFEAFGGNDAVGIMNVVDEYGSFNTAAVPIWKDGHVVGIVCVDIEDTFLAQSEHTSRTNAIILISSLAITMGAMLFVVFMLLKRIRHMQNRLERMAHYDAVTNLPNRQYLFESLAEITTQSKQCPSFALLFIDLDNFKKVNDNAGHDAGDELLRSIAAYLGSIPKPSKVFRPSPGMLNIAARIGGDEFVLLVPNVHTVQDAARVAEKLLEGFETQVRSKSRWVEKYMVGLSVGVALYPYHTNNYHVLIKYADIAMYHAKKSGKNCYRVYDEDMKPSDEK